MPKTDWPDYAENARPSQCIPLARLRRKRSGLITVEGDNWHIAMRPGKRRALDGNDRIDQLTEQVERIKASIRAKVEHPFRVLKRQFGHVKVRYRGLAKNTAQLHTLFALANLWLVRRKLDVATA